MNCATNNNDVNNYIISTAIKCSDGKTRRLSYDLTNQTEGSVHEFGRVFSEIEKDFLMYSFGYNNIQNMKLKD